MHLLVEAQWVWTVFQALFEQLIHIRCCFRIHSVCISCLWELLSLYGGMSLIQRKTYGGRNNVAVLYNINRIKEFRASKQWLQALCSDWTKHDIFIRSTIKFGWWTELMKHLGSWPYVLGFPVVLTWSKQGKQRVSRKSVQGRDGTTDNTGYIWSGQERDLALKLSHNVLSLLLFRVLQQNSKLWDTKIQL